jgi:deoxyadenosine/deoxycytidine kinase
MSYALHGMHVLDSRDLDLLCALHARLATLDPPDRLVLVLDAPLHTLRARIESRGRVFEQSIKPSYLLEISARLEAYLETVTNIPVIRIDTQRHDLRRDDAVCHVMGAIRAAL